MTQIAQRNFSACFAASEADIFCFQEEWEKDSFFDGARRLIPTEAGEAVNAHWWPGGCGIATTLPLVPIEFGLSRRTAAAVEVSDSRYVVVVSAHLICCGFAGSEQDQDRITQARELVDRIQRLRRGQYGAQFKDAAVVVVGDYNLVVSRHSLDIVKTAGVIDWLLHRVGDRSAVTWRGEDSEFWPGRLDLLAFDPERLKKRNGYVLDTALLTPEELAGLGLRADDSSVSDHLMLNC